MHVLVGFVLACLGLSANAQFCNDVLVAPSFCHNIDQQKCEQDRDYLGCDAIDYCYPRETPNGCPLNCPPICNATELFCLGNSGQDGCPKPHTCIPKVDPVTGCNNHCPPQCLSSQQVCPGLWKDCRGSSEPCCRPAPFCHSKDQQCPDQTFNPEGCPIIELELQYLTCSPGSMPCSGGHDMFGCPLKPYCHNKPQIATHCTPYCPAACNRLFEVACPKTYDLNGCEEPPTCSRFVDQCPKNKHTPDTGCPLFKPSSCPDGKQSCLSAPVYKKVLAPVDDFVLHGGNNICDQAPTCEPAVVQGFRKECPAFCPVHCVMVSSTSVLLGRFH